MPSLKRIAIFAGAFLGPFAGLLTAAILPEIAETYNITVDIAAQSLLVYMLPFSTMMLFSGAIGQRIGKARAVSLGYIAFALSSVVCFTAPTWEMFLVGFGLCGLSNALTTPILLTILRETTALHMLGKRLGLFASMQALGQMSSPFLSGVLATFNWKIAFLTIALISIVLLIVGLPQSERVPAPTSAGRRRWRVSRSEVSYFVVYFVLGIASLGLPFLIGIYVHDTWSATSVERGGVIMAGGLTVFILSNFIGSFVDRFGARLVTLSGIGVVAFGLTLIPFTTGPVVSTLVWCLIILGAQGSIIALNKQVLLTPGSDSLVSVTQAMRFFGTACSPLVVLPFYLVSPLIGFGFCALVTVLAGAVYIFAREKN